LEPELVLGQSNDNAMNCQTEALAQMRITDILKLRRPVFSFEFFPPKTEEEMIRLFETLKEVKKLDPGYVSVTYGAGGGTRDRTIEIAKRAKNEIGLETMAHLTCVGHSRKDVRSILEELRNVGIDNILALRGDPPAGARSFTPPPNGFSHANELVALVRSSCSVCVGVAGYPEGHIESPDMETDWNYLRQKVMAGADFIITQLFFDNRSFFSFEKRMREKGVAIPIIPGIMPITNYSQLIRFTRMCGAKIPEELARNLKAIKENAQAVRQYGIEYATSQCEELIASGVAAIHFYTLNNSDSSQRIIKNLRHHEN
jgi:methylenetetrahydrofolate reductase (NADPH)